jgi:putative flippase GtrA
VIDEIFVLKFLKFCIVGFSGMIIDFGTTWLLKEKANVNKYLANSSGFILAASSNYLLNRYWTFHSINPRIITEYLSFILISILGLAISNIVIYLINEKMKINFYLAKLFAVGVVTVWNFFMNYAITFK